MSVKQIGKKRCTVSYKWLINDTKPVHSLAHSLICDPREKSCTYLYLYVPNIFACDLLVQEKILKNIPPFYPFLGAGPFVTLRTSFDQT